MALFLLFWVLFVLTWFSILRQDLFNGVQELTMLPKLSLKSRYSCLSLKCTEPHPACLHFGRAGG